MFKHSMGVLRGLHLSSCTPPLQVEYFPWAHHHPLCFWGPAAQVRWWRCCNSKCGHVEPAHTTIASGPGDVLNQADKLWQQGAMLYQVQNGCQRQASGEPHK